MSSNPWDVVNDSLHGRRAVDEETLASLAALSERLKNFKRANPQCSGVGFSSHVKKLKVRQDVLTPG